MLGSGTAFAGRNEIAAANRALVKELKTRGHDVLILEQLPESKERRKARRPRRVQTGQFRSVTELKARYAPRVRDAHVVIVGSRLSDGNDVGKWVTRVATGVTAFYDNDTGTTLDQLEHGTRSSGTRSLLPKFDLYLSDTRETDLEKLQRDYGSRMARSLPTQDAADFRAAQLERFVAEAMSGQLMA